MSLPVTLTFQQVNQTKGAIRYGEVLPSGKVAQAPNDPGAVIGVLYIRKTAFNGSGIFPETVKVVVTME